MAKKRVAVKAGKKKPAKPARSSRPVPKPKPRPKQPRLSGVEDLPADRVLDQLCESLADSMALENQARSDQADTRRTALARMIKTGRQVYRAHGVEIIHVHGDDKLKVKQIKSDEGGTDPGDDAQADEPSGDGTTAEELNAPESD